MRFNRPAARLRIAAFFVFAALLMSTATTFVTTASAEAVFPYDQTLVLDARPIKPVKRMPGMTVAENGNATIDLWCRTVAARVLVIGSAVQIETAPLPEALPQYMSDGQCNETRVAADNDLLAAMAQISSWRKRGDGVELSGAPGTAVSPLRFILSSH